MENSLRAECVNKVLLYFTFTLIQYGQRSSALAEASLYFFDMCWPIQLNNNILY